MTSTSSAGWPTAGRPLRGIVVAAKPGTTNVGGSRSVITMLADARVLRRTARGVETATFNDLHVGPQVSAWFNGPVLLSYPSQARGELVVIEP